MRCNGFMIINASPPSTAAVPIITTGSVSASPMGVNRIGTDSTRIAVSFSDPDTPTVSILVVTFKVREPDNATELTVADHLNDGAGGMTITGDGAGNYTAFFDWNPPDAQTLGVYDLYVMISDTLDSVVDGYAANPDELSVTEPYAGTAPSIVTGATIALPDSLNRTSASFALIRFDFTDPDSHSRKGFTATIKVRDASSTEYILANALTDDSAGLSIWRVNDTVYRAEVKWDPGDAQTLGVYDLYAQVEDPSAQVATDGYANNTDELLLYAEAPTGDGHLTHRGTTADGCGGANSACHNLLTHDQTTTSSSHGTWTTQPTCLTCHTPHTTHNLYMVRDSIDTPNSGKRQVVFKTLGIGDPYNDPDPTVGDASSGVMADDTDGAGTGICEVCHTATTHHRNDDSHSLQGHENAQTCTNCHSHQGGFAAGESGGGQACSCHGPIFTAMDSTSLLSRHVLANDSADYSPGASGMYATKNCLACHVDHDIFRPDLNTGFGQRAKNLRTDWAIDPVQGSDSVLAGSDYLSTGNGGVCLSCHSGSTCSGCHSAHRGALGGLAAAEAASFSHLWITQSDYDAATNAHNYSVPTTFGTDGSTFNGNCVKCHNDNMGKSYQNSTYKFSVHGSDFDHILDSAGTGGASSPLEEEFCYKCHSTTSNPNAGSNLDYFGVTSMGAASNLAIEADMGLASAHPVGSFSGIHGSAENADTLARHVECSDCHNPHAARTSASPSVLLKPAVVGAIGRTIDSARVMSVSATYEVCLKCHGDNNGGTAYVYRENGSTNTRLEFHPTSLSFHPVADTGKNANSPSLTGGWTETSMMGCEDCHSRQAGGAAGPHGSQYSPILKLDYVTGDDIGHTSANYALCYSCHLESSILGDNSFAEHDKHIRGERTPCSVCHDPHGVNSVAAGDGVHLINFDTTVVTPESGSGRLEFINGTNDFQGTCWLQCHGTDHDGWNY